MKLVLAAAVGIAALISAAPAQADSIDQQFLNLVTSETNLTNTDGDSGIISAGHQVCHMLAQGYSENDVYRKMTSHYGGPDRADASKFIGLAEGMFCPQYA